MRCLQSLLFVSFSYDAVGRHWRGSLRFDGVYVVIPHPGYFICVAVGRPGTVTLCPCLSTRIVLSFVASGPLEIVMMRCLLPKFLRSVGIGILARPPDVGCRGGA